MTPTPIVHLSIPVADPEASAAYYEAVLGCRRGRSTDRFVDVWFFGAQLTLVRHNGTAVAEPAPDYAPHFGAIVAPQILAEAWERVRADPRSTVISPLASAGVGTALEQTKMMFSDPDGHAIELKTYADVDTALGGIARDAAQENELGAR